MGRPGEPPTGIDPAERRTNPRHGDDVRPERESSSDRDDTLTIPGLGKKAWVEIQMSAF
jgi:hypothetical protein